LVEKPITDSRRCLREIDCDALDAVITRTDIDNDSFVDARRANHLWREHRLVERRFVLMRAGPLANALGREEKVIAAARMDRVVHKRPPGGIERDTPDDRIEPPGSDVERVRCSMRRKPERVHELQRRLVVDHGPGNAGIRHRLADIHAYARQRTAALPAQYSD